MSFGERVLEALRLKGMTREELYAVTGLKSSYLVGYIKNPDRAPTLTTACKIARALDVSLDYLGGLIDEPRPPHWARMPEYADARQARINEQYADMNERGKVRASESVDDIHANPQNRAGVSPEADAVGGAVGAA